MAMQCGGGNSGFLLAFSSGLYNSLAYFSRVNAMVNHSLLCKTNIHSKAQSKYSQLELANLLIKSQFCFIAESKKYVGVGVGRQIASLGAGEEGKVSKHQQTTINVVCRGSFLSYTLFRQSYGQPNFLAASGICRLDCSLQKTNLLT